MCDRAPEKPNRTNRRTMPTARTVASVVITERVQVPSYTAHMMSKTAR